MTRSHNTLAPTGDRFLRRPDVEAMTGLGTSTLYRYINSGIFPRPLVLGPKAVAWRESAVQAWMASREVSPLGLEVRSPAAFTEVA
ncbi:AlpA family transcriptional regulator [Bosea vestrisii]|uniref:helix-turn-helix transcriptional regulator n=1 Tax=Bosea vestrisii TaxID=151416 RepID=UPI0024E004F0|nr:AlpA family transcriptional regulator [Bosea vestrisii]WID96993.1 AlpA family transcriptional regulator [Bosea vestrisii]